MQMKSKTLLLVAALAVLTAPALAQEHSGHEGHDMSAMMSVGEGGSWSYTERENSKMLLHGRWETVPLGGRASVAISAAGMSFQTRCAALMASESLIHDHATRAACTGEKQPAMPGTDHGHHGHDK